MADTGIPGLSGRPRLPDHLLTTIPTNLAATPLTPDKTDQLIEALLQSLTRLENMIGIKVHATKDNTGWDIRIDQPQRNA